MNKPNGKSIQELAADALRDILPAGAAPRPPKDVVTDSGTVAYWSAQPKTERAQVGASLERITNHCPHCGAVLSARVAFDAAARREAAKRAMLAALVGK